jgi:ribose transport system substrate-binding protein
MKKILGIALILALLFTPLLVACDSSSVDSGGGETKEKHKIGVLAPAVTHGWVAAVAYNAEERSKELSDEIEYNIQTSSNAEEMTAQLDDLMTWGADAIVAFPQWEGMEFLFKEH